MSFRPFFAAAALLLAAGCGPSADTAEPAAPAAPAPDPRFRTFTLAGGDCPTGDTLTIELSDGVPIRVPVVSAIAQPSITITSMRGETVSTREGSGYTLYVADYPLDPANPGPNPPADRTKLEFTFITQDHTPVVPGLYGKQKENLAVGPNLFHGGRAYPMKNNFVGGVNVTVVDGERFCGEIRLKSKYDVVIEGGFRAGVVAGPAHDERP
jgi:hypothetical protein